MVGSRLNSSHIRFYISDYGFGHASRCIALIRALHESIDCKISVRTYTSAEFIHDSCPFVSVDKKQNDIGAVIYPGTSTVDVFGTETNLKKWIETWPSWIEDETKFCRENNVSLIISDITPQAFILSKSLNILGIGISNFTWSLIFKNLFGSINEVKLIENAYKQADFGIVLPLNESMNLFQNKISVPLISRKITRNRKEMRKQFGISENDKVIYVGSGLSFNAVPDCIPDLLDSGYHVLVSGNCSHVHKNLIKIPHDDLETQDYIGMCDLVITKPGYSTVSESIRAKVPILIFKRDGFAEDEYIIRPLTENRIGTVLPWDEIASGTWIERIYELMSMKDNYDSCSDIFIKDGITDILYQIKACL